ncbi:MAG TPA: Uma2 family endonuclease [Chthonomonadales bacterium]|nr:Uma2 family endonuclease [Chthonomonadales bacterium]
MVADKSQVSDGIYMTVEQYLALDEATDAKYEYLDGYVFMLRPPSAIYDDNAIVDMAGGSNAHAALCLRMGSLLDQALTEGDCMAFTSDARMKLAARQYLDPDLTVACGEGPGTMLTNPVVIFEVLSPATEKRDRGAKFNAYKALPSLQEYVLIGSEYKAIEVRRREGNFWRTYHYRSGDLVELQSIGVSFPFDALYRRIPM